MALDGWYHFLPAQGAYCYLKLGDCDDLLFFTINLHGLGLPSESRKHWRELELHHVS